MKKTEQLDIKQSSFFDCFSARVRSSGRFSASIRNTSILNPLKVTGLVFAIVLTSVFALNLSGEENKGANEKVGVRPYEMDWANRTTDDFPPLIDFETFGQWKVEAVDSVATFTQSREQQIFGKYTGKLTYRGTGKKPVVTVTPEKPVPVPATGFDAMSCWICGNNWAWVTDKSTPRVTVEFLFKTADGKELAYSIAYVCWKEWFLCHRRFSSGEQKLVNAPGTLFTGFRVTGGSNVEDRTIWIDNIAMFKEIFKPLEFSKRAKRGIDMFPGQDCGQNTGEGRLPFPNRETTILPVNKDRAAVNSLRLDGKHALFTYIGTDGKLDVAYVADSGTWHDLAVRWNQSNWFYPVDNGGINTLVNAKGEVEPVLKRENLVLKVDGKKLIVQWRLTSRSASAVVEYNLQLMGKSIVLDTFVKGGNVSEVSFGNISGFRDSKTFKVPYYSYGGPNRPYAALVRIDGTNTPLFVMAHTDWYRSNASSVSGLSNSRAKDRINGTMLYNEKTDGKRNDVYERFFIAVSPDFEEVLPEIPNPASPWKHIAGTKVWQAHGASADRQNDYRFFRDIWRHGIRQVVITDHEVGWRDGGESFTFRVKAAPKKGGDQGMFDYARFMQDELKFTYGPYNNFTDFAPVNGYWSYDMISRTSDSQLQKAWARCYAPKPARAVEFCEKLTPIIESKFHFSTAYCDVHTSVTPWSRTDYDARVPGAGTFAAVFYPYGEIMLIQKKNWNGPVYSEGPHHCFYSGLTDGNYAQDRGYYIPGEPWLLNFDLRKMHDLECNFGIGDPSMYDPKLQEHYPKTEEERHAFVDRYFAAMLAFGHPGFLTSNFGMPIAMKSYFMVQPIAARYTQTSADKILYLDENGREYGISEALAKDVFKRSQHIIVYKDKTFVAVNGSLTESMTFDLDAAHSVPLETGDGFTTRSTITLPPSGYLCFSDDKKVFVQSLITNNSRSDYSVSPEAIYLNARGRFHRHPKAAGAGNGVCRFLEKGEFEVIVTDNREMGFKIDADSAIALSKDLKEIGPAQVRKCRGYLYVQPVDGAFSYRLTKSGKSLGPEVEADRFYVAPGEKLVVRLKNEPAKSFEIDIPMDAKPGENRWFETVKGGWVNFVIIDPVEAAPSLADNIYLTVQADASIRLPKPMSILFDFNGKTYQPMRTKIKKALSTTSSFEIPAPKQVGTENGTITVTSERFKRVMPVKFETKFDFNVSDLDFIGENGLVPTTWMEFRGKARQSEMDNTGATAIRTGLDCGDLVKQGYFMHPPYLSGAGRVYLEYELTVPDFNSSKPIFRASVGKSNRSDIGDGIAFKIAVLEGEKEVILTETNLAEHKWIPIEADLSKYTGQKIVLRLISDCGAANNTVGDWSCWAEMRITSTDKKYTRSIVK